MTILEALKTENLDLRYHGRCLYFDEGEWVVTNTGSRSHEVLYRGTDEQEAVRVLLED